MNQIWQTLGIEKTKEISVIRKAYAKLAAEYSPEDHPEQFLAIRIAYEAAMNYANTAGGDKADDSHLAKETGQEKRTQIFPEEDQHSADKITWTFDSGEDNEADNFRDSDAIRQFRSLYLSKSKADKNLWIKYFSSDAFLDVFQEKGFAKLLLEEVEANLAEYPPHKNFLLSLALTYALAKPKDEQENVFFHQGFADFDGIEYIRAITAKGPRFHEVKGMDLAILNGYRDYFSCLHLNRYDDWDDQTSAQFSELMRRYASAYIKDKVPQSSGYPASDHLPRHPSSLNLVAHFLSVATLPSQAYAVVWERLKLKTAIMGRDKLLYGRLREIALAHCPELVHEEKAKFLELRKEYAEYFKRCALRQTAEEDAEDAERRDVDQFFARDEIESAFADRAFVDDDILPRWTRNTSSTYFLQKVVQTVDDNPSTPYGNQLLEKARRILKLRETEEKLKADEAGELPDSPADVSNRAYFRYLLNVSFHQGYSYRRSISLASYLADQFAYAKPYAKKLLSFDEASRQCMENRNVTLAFSEDDQLDITFHLYYVSYMRNQQPVYAPFIHFNFIADQEDEGLFWLLLPLTFAHENQEDDVLQAIRRRLTNLGFFEEDSCTIIAECLTMMICKDYEEDFYPGQLIIYGESSELLYFSEIYLNEGTLLICKKQINGWREVLRNEPYPKDDVHGAIDLSHRLLAEYTQPFNLDTLRIHRLPNAVFHGWNHRKQQSLHGDDVTFESVKDLLTAFLDGELERLELFWEGQERVTKGFPSRSLVFLKTTPFMGKDPEYACFCFDHLSKHRYMLLSHPEIYQGPSEYVKYAPFNARLTATYTIHKNTERIGSFLNRAIAQVSDLTTEVPHIFDMWNLEVYYNSKDYFELDLYLLGGYAYDHIAEKVSRNFMFYDYPEYMEAKSMDGESNTWDMKIKNSFVVKQQLQEFMAGKLTRLRFTWKMKQTEETKAMIKQQAFTPHQVHILLLNDDDRYLLIHFDDHRRCFHYLVYDKEAYTGDGKLKDVMFNGSKHRPYVIHHDLEKIRESLSLLLPNIFYPDDILRIYGQYAYCTEMQVGKTVKDYEETKALYFAGE